MAEHDNAPDETQKALIKRAYNFAKEAHKGQKRNSGEPYFNHVYAAGKNCARFGMDTAVVIAGLLHDTVEDTPVTAEDVEENFDQEVRFLVEGVTKLGKLKYRGRERHVESLRKFFVAVAEDVRVLVIKLADRLHNLQTLEHVREDKQKRIALESIEVHAALAARLGMARLSAELETLAFPFAYPSEYAMVTDLMKRRKKADKKYLEKVHRSLRRKLADAHFTDVEMHYRTKGIFSLYRKLRRKDMDIDKIYDIVALRVMVPTIEDCYRVLGIIHSSWRPFPGRIKDYIASPKPNGYQSLHTTIFTGDGGIAEIQIRTPEMHDVAEYGIASHYNYKGVYSSSEVSNGKNFNWLNQLRDFQKEQLKPAEFMKELKTDFFEDRIFIFTPLGDVIDLPKGATIIDFAYAIHSDIGNHLCSAKVNGDNKALKTELKNRDVVEVEHKDSCRPSSKWLYYAKTTLAKKHIKNMTKDEGMMQRWFKS